MLANRSGVGQASEKISAGGTLRSLILEGILDRNPEFGASREEHTKMILGEIILLAVVQGQHSGNAVAATKRDTECRLQSRCAGGSREMQSFCSGIAVGNWFLVSRHPAGKALPQWNSQGRKEVKVQPVDIFRNQHTFLANEEDDGFVGNHLLQADGYHRESFL